MKSIVYFVSCLFVLSISACSMHAESGNAKKKDGEVVNIKVNGYGSISIDMVYVAGGEFTWGDTMNQISGVNEKTTRNVKMRGFYIGKYEVTQHLWTYVMGENPSEFRGDENLPVENITVRDCHKFISKLNEMTGLNFRLPTQTEWAYAAQGGQKSQGYKYSGSDTISDVAWFGEEDFVGSTHPVGQKKPNELGIYDMSGNVWECWEYWYGDTASYDDPVHFIRGILGGSWCGLAKYCRCSDLNDFAPDHRYYCIGLRLALSE